MVIQDLLWANPDIKSVAPQASFSSLKFPEESGRVIETYSAPASNKTIYLIQDAHTNESAQKNIAAILDALIEKEKIKYVFLEAGTGDDSLSSLRSLAPQPKRKSVADIYLKKAWIQGPDYLDLTSEKPLQLWGVEDKSLYFRGIELYRTLVKEREHANAALDRFERALGTLKPKLFNPTLLEFDAQRAGYLKGELPVTDYFDFLAEKSGKQGISLLGYPALLALKEVRKKESQIDFKKSNEELQKIFLTLEAGERVEFLAALNRQADAAAGGMTGTGKLADIYISLKAKIKDPGLYPDFERYVDYLQAMQKVGDVQFLSELQELEGRIAEALTTNEPEGALLEISRSTELLRRLINLQAGSNDIKALNEKPVLYDPVEIGGRLNRELMLLQSHYEDAIFLDKEYGDAFKAAKEFYALTEERDDVFIKNILQKMSDEKADKAAFVSGGFHSESLTRKLKEKGVSYISILPRVLQETNQKRYETLLLGQPSAPPTVGVANLWNTLPAVEFIPATQNGARLTTKEFLKNEFKVVETSPKQGRTPGGIRSTAKKVVKKAADNYFSETWIEKNGTLYKLLGVKIFIRLYMATYGLIPGVPREWELAKHDKLRERYKFSKDAEIIHLAAFFLLAAITSPGQLSGVLFAINIIFNFYPVITQRYVRNRLRAIVEHRDNTSTTSETVSGPTDGARLAPAVLNWSAAVLMFFMAGCFAPRKAETERLKYGTQELLDYLRGKGPRWSDRYLLEWLNRRQGLAAAVEAKEGLSTEQKIELYQLSGLSADIFREFGVVVYGGSDTLLAQVKKAFSEAPPSLSKLCKVLLLIPRARFNALGFNFSKMGGFTAPNRKQGHLIFGYPRDLSKLPEMIDHELTHLWWGGMTPDLQKELAEIHDKNTDQFSHISEYAQYGLVDSAVVLKAKTLQAAGNRKEFWAVLNSQFPGSTMPSTLRRADEAFAETAMTWIIEPKKLFLDEAMDTLPAVRHFVEEAAKVFIFEKNGRKQMRFYHGVSPNLRYFDVPVTGTLSYEELRKLYAANLPEKRGARLASKDSKIKPKGAHVSSEDSFKISRALGNSFLGGAILFAADQITKTMIRTAFPSVIAEQKIDWKTWGIVHTEHLSASPTVYAYLIFLSSFAFVLLIARGKAFSEPRITESLKLASMFMLGGFAGNVFDMEVRASVTDWILVPGMITNLADVFLFVAIIHFLYSIFLGNNFTRRAAKKGSNEQSASKEKSEQDSGARLANKSVRDLMNQIKPGPDTVVYSIGAGKASGKSLEAIFLEKGSQVHIFEPNTKAWPDWRNVSGSGRMPEFHGKFEEAPDAPHPNVVLMMSVLSAPATSVPTKSQEGIREKLAETLRPGDWAVLGWYDVDQLSVSALLNGALDGFEEMQHHARRLKDLKKSLEARGLGLESVMSGQSYKHQWVAYRIATPGASAKQLTLRDRVRNFLASRVLWFSGVLFALDQLSKILVRLFVPVQAAPPGGLSFGLTHTEHGGSISEIIGAFVVEVLFLTILFIKAKSAKWTDLKYRGLGLLIGGFAANTLDLALFGTSTNVLATPLGAANLADLFMIAGVASVFAGIKNETGEESKDAGTLTPVLLPMLQVWFKLTEADLEEVSCPLCGKHDFETVAVNQINGFSLPIVRCKNDGMIFLQKRPNASWWKKIYSSPEYYANDLKHAFGYGADYRLSEVRRRLDAAGRLRDIEALRDGQKGVLLDVGSAKGYFISEARQNGWKTIGIDPSAVLSAGVKDADSRVISSTWQDADLGEELVDVVHFSDVLEHLSDPLGALIKAKAVLKPDGLLVVRVPDLSHLTQENMPFVLDFSREHLYYFNRDTMARLLAMSGFDLLEARPSGAIPLKNGEKMHAMTYFAKPNAGARLTGEIADDGRRFNPIPPDGKILAFGSSSTSGVTEVSPRMFYPSILGRMLGYRTIINEGVAGEKIFNDDGITGGAKRLPEVLDKHKPALLILWHGRNDLLSRRSEADVEQGLLRMISEAKKRNIQVLLLGSHKADELKDAPLYRRVAEETGVPYLPDIYVDVLPHAELRADSIHLNEHGNLIVAQNIKDFLVARGAVVDFQTDKFNPPLERGVQFLEQDRNIRFTVGLRTGLDSKDILAVVSYLRTGAQADLTAKITRDFGHGYYEFSAVLPEGTEEYTLKISTDGKAMVDPAKSWSVWGRTARIALGWDKKVIVIPTALTIEDRTKNVIREMLDRHGDIVRPIYEQGVKAFEGAFSFEDLTLQTEPLGKGAQNAEEKYRRIILRLAAHFLFVVSQYAILNRKATAWSSPEYTTGDSVGLEAAMAISGALDPMDYIRFLKDRLALAPRMTQAVYTQLIIHSVPQEEIKSVLVPGMVEAVSYASEQTTYLVLNTSNAQSIGELRQRISGLLGIPAESIETKDSAAVFTHHSFHNDPLLKEMMEMAGKIRFSDPQIPILDSSDEHTRILRTAEQVRDAFIRTMFDPVYWSQAQELMKFSDQQWLASDAASWPRLEERFIKNPSGARLAEKTHLVERVIRDRSHIAELHRTWPAAVGVFGSARIGEDHPYYKLSVALGDALWKNGMIPRTGAGPSMMEGPFLGYVTARNASGVAPSPTNMTQGIEIELPWEQKMNPYTESHIKLDDFITRKIGLHEKLQGVVVLPGGFGTLDEVFEVWRRGRPTVLMGKDFWEPIFLAFFESWKKSGLLSQVRQRGMFKITDSPEEAIDILKKESKKQPPYSTSDAELQEDNREVDESMRKVNALQRSVTFVGKPRPGREVQIAEELVSMLLKENAMPVRVASRGVLLNAVARTANREGRPDLLSAVLFMPRSGKLSTTEQKIANAVYLKDESNHQLVMANNSLAYVFLPGGVGTMNKLFDITVIIQNKKASPKPIVLIGKQFYQPIVDAIERQLLVPDPSNPGFYDEAKRYPRVSTISPEDKKLFIVVDSAQEAHQAIVDFWSKQDQGAAQGARLGGPVGDDKLAALFGLNMAELKELGFTKKNIQEFMKQGFYSEKFSKAYSEFTSWQIPIIENELRKIISRKAAVNDQNLMIYNLGLGSEPLELQQNLEMTLDVLEKTVGREQALKWNITFVAVDGRHETLEAADDYFKTVAQSPNDLLRKVDFKKVRANFLAPDDFPRILGEGGKKADAIFHRHTSYLNEYVAAKSFDPEVVAASQGDDYNLAVLNGYLQLKNIFSSLASKGTLYILEPVGQPNGTNKAAVIPGASVADRATSGVYTVDDPNLMANMNIKDFMYAVSSSRPRPEKNIIRSVEELLAATGVHHPSDMAIEPIPPVKNRRFALTPAEMRTAYKVKKAAMAAMKGLRKQPGFKLTEDQHYYGIYAPAEMGRALSGLKVAGVGSSSTVLDLGHGEGILAHGMAAVLGAEVTGIEASPEYFNRSLKAHEALLAMENLNASKVRLLKDDFLNIPWSGYDFVYYYSYGSRSKRAIASKAAAEMKPGAKFILFGERDKDAPDTHYDEAVIKALLDSGQFTLIRYAEYGTWIFEKAGSRLAEGGQIRYGTYAEIRDTEQKKKVVALLKKMDDAIDNPGPLLSEYGLSYQDLGEFEDYYKHTEILLAYDGDRPVGAYLYGFGLSYDPKKDSFEKDPNSKTVSSGGAYVDGSYQNRGIGSALREMMLATLKENGYEKFVIHKVLGTSVAQDYQKSFISRPGVKTTYRDGGQIDSVQIDLKVFEPIADAGARPAEKKDMEGKQPVGDEWLVYSSRRGAHGGRIYQVRRIPENEYFRIHPYNEGGLARLAKFFPRFAEQLGIRSVGKDMEWPDVNEMNGILKDLGIDVSLVTVQGEIAPLEYIRWLEQRKIPIAHDGYEYFHDMGLHFIPFLLMFMIPETSDYLSSQVKATIELYEKAAAKGDSDTADKISKMLAANLDEYTADISYSILAGDWSDSVYQTLQGAMSEKVRRMVYLAGERWGAEAVTKDKPISKEQIQSIAERFSNILNHGIETVPVAGARLTEQGIHETYNGSGELVSAVLHTERGLEIHCERLLSRLAGKYFYVAATVDGVRVDEPMDTGGGKIPGIFWVEETGSETPFLKFMYMELTKEAQGKRIGPAFYNWLRQRAYDRGMRYEGTSISNPVAAHSLLKMLDEKTVVIKPVGEDLHERITPAELKALIDTAFQNGTGLPYSVEISGYPLEKPSVVSRTEVVGARLAAWQQDSDRSADSTGRFTYRWQRFDLGRRYADQAVEIKPMSSVADEKWFDERIKLEDELVHQSFLMKDPLGPEDKQGRFEAWVNGERILLFDLSSGKYLKLIEKRTYSRSGRFMIGSKSYTLHSSFDGREVEIKITDKGWDAYVFGVTLASFDAKKNEFRRLYTYRRTDAKGRFSFKGVRYPTGEKNAFKDVILSFSGQEPFEAYIDYEPIPIALNGTKTGARLGETRLVDTPFHYPGEFEVARLSEPAGLEGYEVSIKNVPRNDEMKEWSKFSVEVFKKGDTKPISGMIEFIVSSDKKTIDITYFFPNFPKRGEPDYEKGRGMRLLRLLLEPYMDYTVLSFAEEVFQTAFKGMDDYQPMNYIEDPKGFHDFIYQNMQTVEDEKLKALWSSTKIYGKVPKKAIVLDAPAARPAGAAQDSALAVSGARMATISNLKTLMTTFFVGVALANPQVSNAQVPLKADLKAPTGVYEFSKQGSRLVVSLNGEEIVADVSKKAVIEQQTEKSMAVASEDKATVADIKVKVDTMNEQVSAALETAGLSQDKPVIVDIDLGFIEGKSFDAYLKNLIGEIKALKRRDAKAMFRLAGKENLVQNALDEPSAQGVFTQDISKDFESAARVNVFSPEISSVKSGSVNVPAQPLDEAAPAFQAMLQLAVALGRVDTKNMPSGVLDAWSTLAGTHLTTQIAGDIADGRADVATMKLYSLKPVLEKVGEYLRYLSLRLRQLGQSA